MTKIRKKIQQHAKAVPVTSRPIRQPQTVNASLPRHIKISKDLRLSSNPPAPSPGSDPSIVNIEGAQLGQSLSLALLREEELLHQKDVLVIETLALRAEVFRLNAFLQQKNNDHDNEMEKIKLISHQEGVSAAAEEMQKMWSSHEFAAELMYGKRFSINCK